MIVIALGANLASHAGTPEKTIRAALAELERKGLMPVAVSPFYATEAWPDPREPTYVNAVAKLETSLAPDALLGQLLEVEKKFGRTRGQRNSPRTLDLDLIDYNGRVQAGPPVLPHPGMHERAFVLVPLGDIAPDWRHPVSGISLRELLAALPDRERHLTKLCDGST